MRSVLDMCQEVTNQGVIRAREQNVSDSLIPKDLREESARRGHHNPFVALQNQLPGLPILPAPDFSQLVIATSANFIQRVALSGNVQLVSFSSFTTGLYFVSFGGQCQLPPVAIDDGLAKDMIVSPTGMLIYAKGMYSLSVGIVNNGDVVSVLGWEQVP